MRRRDFFKAVVGSATTWPLAAYPQAEKLPRIGFMGASASVFSPWTAARAPTLAFA